MWTTTTSPFCSHFFISFALLNILFFSISFYHTYDDTVSAKNRFAVQSKRNIIVDGFIIAMDQSTDVFCQFYFRICFSCIFFFFRVMAKYMDHFATIWSLNQYWFLNDWKQFLKKKKRREQTNIMLFYDSLVHRNWINIIYKSDKEKE